MILKSLNKKTWFLIFFFFFNLFLSMPKTLNIGLNYSKKIIKNEKIGLKLKKHIEYINNFQNDSENLVFAKILTDEISIKSNHGFLVYLDDQQLQQLKNNKNIEEKSVKNQLYTPQFGLQGIIFSLLYNNLNIKNFELLHLLNVLCINFLLIYLLNWIYIEFKLKAMLFSSLSIYFLSTMFIGVEKNLYWIIWIYFLPMCLSICVMKSNNTSSRLFYLIIFPFISILLKCLNGYEFMSTVLINMEIPIIYYYLKKNAKMINLIKICSIVGISGILGFVVAIMLHVKKLLVITNDLKSAFNLFLYPIIYRTNLLGYKLPELSGIIGKDYKIFEKSLNVSMVEVLEIYLLNSKIMLVIILLIIFIIKDLKNKENIPLIVSIILSFVGVLSWIILAKGHSYIHTHINPVLWNIPFLMLSFAYFGIQFEKYVRRK